MSDEFVHDNSIWLTSQFLILMVTDHSFMNRDDNCQNIWPFLSSLDNKIYNLTMMVKFTLKLYRLALDWKPGSPLVLSSQIS